MANFEELQKYVTYLLGTYNPRNRAEIEDTFYFNELQKKVGNNWFFETVNVNSSYKEISWGFDCYAIEIINDTNFDLTFSWDGIKTDGVFYTKESSVIDNIRRNKIFIKGTSSGGTIRIWSF